MAKIAIKNWLSCALNAFIWERKPATNSDTSEPKKVSGIKKPRTEECEAFSITPKGVNYFLLLQEFQNGLRRLICLRQHRRTGLLNDLRTSKFCRLRGIIGILHSTP